MDYNDWHTKALIAGPDSQGYGPLVIKTAIIVTVLQFSCKHYLPYSGINAAASLGFLGSGSVFPPCATPKSPSPFGFRLFWLPNYSLEAVVCRRPISLMVSSYHCSTIVDWVVTRRRLKAHRPTPLFQNPAVNYCEVCTTEGTLTGVNSPHATKFYPALRQAWGRTFAWPMPSQCIRGTA